MQHDVPRHQGSPSGHTHANRHRRRRRRLCRPIHGCTCLGLSSSHTRRLRGLGSPPIRSACPRPRPRITAARKARPWPRRECVRRIRPYAASSARIEHHRRWCGGMRPHRRSRWPRGGSGGGKRSRDDPAPKSCSWKSCGGGCDARENGGGLEYSKPKEWADRPCPRADGCAGGRDETRSCGATQCHFECGRPCLWLRRSCCSCAPERGGTRGRPEGGRSGGC